MEYPKKIMSITELVNIGFKRSYLNQVVHARGQKFATPTYGGGKWMIDVDEFEKFRKKCREQHGRVDRRFPLK